MHLAVDHHHTDLGDVRLHWVSAGEGDPVVLLHGWPQTWFMWRKVIPGLAERYQVIAPDLRGLGDSSRPADGYDKKTIANDVWRLAHNTLGLQRFFVVGHDWGGPVAYAFAAHHPEATRRLVILDVPLPGDGTEVMYGNRWHHGLHWEPDFPEALTVGREDVYLGHFYRNWGAHPNVISETEQAEYLRTYRHPGAMRAGFNYYRATPRDVADNEAMSKRFRLPMPVLVFGGTEGRARGMAAIESWRRVADDVRGGVAQGCGHWIPEEAPEWLLGEMLAFFAEETA
jgi:pimeloyl-ACP methyl ester carboxylesterase